MPSLYEMNESDMDETVDEELGDTVEISVAGGAWLTQMGFVLINTQAAGGFAELDTLLNKKRLKIHKRRLPDPYVAWRVRSPKLDGDYKLSSGTVAESGRYWLLDLQKV